MAHVNGSEPDARERRAFDRRRHWVRLIGEWERSGSSQAEFCRERKVSIQTFRWWKSRLAREEPKGRSGGRATSRTRKKAPSDAFVPVEVVDPFAGHAIELVCGPRTLRIRGDFDPSVLEKVVRTLEGLAC